MQFPSIIRGNQSPARQEWPKNMLLAVRNDFTELFETFLQSPPL